METPKFDPNKPFEELDTTPQFNPDQPFEEVSTESQTPIFEEPISEQPKIKAAAISGGLATEALSRGVSEAGQYGLEKIGKLTPAQMKTITEASEDYRKARSFSDLIDQFQELAQQTRQAGFEARKRGVESLEGLSPIKGQEVIPQLGDITKGPVMELSQEELPQVRKTPSKKASDLQKLLDEKQALENKLGAVQESGIESIERNKEINSLSERLNKVNTDLTKNIVEASRFPTETIPPTLEDFEKATNIPGELLQARPELANKKIQEELGKVLRKEIDFLKTGSITPKNLASYVRSLQDQLSYLPNPSEAEKFKQEIARNVSNYLKNLEGAEGYAKGQAQSQKAIQLEKGMREFGLGLDSEKNIKITNPEKVEKLYKSGNQKEIDRLNKYIEQAQQLQIDMNVPLQSEITPSTIDRFQTELPFATIKKTVQEASDKPMITSMKRGLGSLIGSSIGGVPGGFTGYSTGAALPTGTKVQEAVSLAKGSGLYKTASKASKFLGPLGALVAGGMAYKGAEEAGLEGLEKAGVTAGEVINPIPFTDVTGAYVAGKKELEKGVVPAAKAAGEAFIKPAKEMIEEPTAIDFNSEALRRMERGEAIPKVEVYKGKLKSDNLDEISSIAKTMQSSNDRVSQEYGRVLSQIQNASPRERDAILFGLNQKTEFRELVRKIKGQTEE